MQGVKLTEQEIVELLDQYESEIRKLRFLIEQKKQAIAELKAIEVVPTPIAKAATTTTTRKKKGRPAKKKTAAPENGQSATVEKAKEEKPAVAKKRPGRPKKQSTAEPKAKATPKTKKATTKTAAQPKAKKESGATGGYRLSDWDLLILDSLESRQKVMINADLLEAGKKKVSNENLGLDEKQIQGKINRSLQKLVNKRNMLSKADYPGKGNAYGLADWAGPDGVIRKKYQL